MKSRSLSKGASNIGALFLFFYIGALSSCSRSPAIPPADLAYLKQHTTQLSGAALGTTYKIAIYTPTVQQSLLNTKKLQRNVDQEIKRLNQIFSSWQPDSELNRIQNHRSRSCIQISRDMRQVLSHADNLHHISEHAFDPGQARLIGVYGFGPVAGDRAVENFTNQQTIKSLWNEDGWSRAFQLKDCGLVHKNKAARLDVSALAKGYIVDKVYKILNKELQGRDPQYHFSLMVEIGGEIRVGPGRKIPAEHSSSAKPINYAWRLGIEEPRYDPGRSLWKTVTLKNMSMATSGDYRNFRIDPANPDKILSHIIDLRTGKPTASKVRSATVIGPDCMQADALATTLMILGKEEGIELLKAYPGYEAYLILAEKPGNWQIEKSPGFAKFLIE